MSASKLLIKLGLDPGPFNSKLKKVENSAKKTFGQLEKAAKKVAIGAVGVGASGAGMVMFMDKTLEATSKIEGLNRSLGNIGFEEAQQLAFKLNKELGLKSLDDATSRLSNARDLTGATGKELEALAVNTGLINQRFKKFSEEEAIQAQGAMMKVGYSAKESADAFIYLAEKGGDLKGELGQTLTEYSVQFKEAGFDLKSTVGILDGGLGKGWNLDAIADAFKEGRLKIAGGDKAANKAMAALGLNDLPSQIKEGKISVEDAMNQIYGKLKGKKQIDQFNLGKDLFGPKFEDAGTDAMIASMEGMSKQPKFKGAANRLQKELGSTMGHKWNATWSKLENVINKTLIKITPIMLPLVDIFADGVQWIGDFADKYENIAQLIGLSVPIVLGLGAGLGALSIAAGIASAAFALFPLPVLLTVAAIGLLAWGAYELWDVLSSPEAVALFNNGLDAVGESINAVWDWTTSLVDKVGTLWGTMTGGKDFLDVLVDLGIWVAKNLTPFGQLFQLVEKITEAFSGFSPKEGLSKMVNAVLPDWVAQRIGLDVNTKAETEAAKKLGIDQPTQPKTQGQAIRYRDLKQHTSRTLQSTVGGAQPAGGMTVHIGTLNSNSRDTGADLERLGRARG